VFRREALTRGQIFFLQASTASSSRSIALRAGCCQDQPCRLINEYTRRADEGKMGYLDFLDLVLSEGTRRPRRPPLPPGPTALPAAAPQDARRIRLLLPARPRPTEGQGPCHPLVRRGQGERRPARAARVGKTHIAVALAVAACRASYSIYFTSLDDMVRNLKAAEAAGRLTNKLGTYLRPSVLVVDEVGYQSLERAEANLVFQVISKRYEKGSIILTSNKTFSEWGQVFGDEVLATAILDRLLHHCDVISINGPSYRLRNRLKAIEREKDVA